MDFFLLGTLIISLMFASGNCDSSSSSCTMVNGKWQCQKQVSTGNVASSDASAGFGSGYEFQRVRTMTGDSRSGEYQQAQSQDGNMPPGGFPGFAGFPFPNFPGSFPFASGVPNFGDDVGSDGPTGFVATNALNTGSSTSGSDSTSSRYAGNSNGGYAGPTGGESVAGGYAAADGGGVFVGGGAFAGGFAMPPGFGTGVFGGPAASVFSMMFGRR